LLGELHHLDADRRAALAKAAGRYRFCGWVSLAAVLVWVSVIGVLLAVASGS
jgi:hypothetical protein